jgi:peptidoglycan LD-endopeptidase LytH
MSKKRLFLPVLGMLLVICAVLIWYLFRYSPSDSNDTIHKWLSDPSSRPQLNTPNDVPCGDAPFLLPSPGLIGLLWRDTARPYNMLNRHTGIDILGDGESGTVPVVAVYDGTLTRLSGWFSTVIIRHDDPLQPGRTIWTYYTHMGNRDGTESYVDAAFPAGTDGVFVEQGTVLGTQGEYNGDSFGIAMHVHVSIVTSHANGMFKNESVLGNTLDPSPYFGMALNSDENSYRPVRCE